MLEVGVLLVFRLTPDLVGPDLEDHREARRQLLDNSRDLEDAVAGRVRPGCPHIEF